MDKTFIMKLDDANDLLGKEQSVGGLEYHPVAFPPHQSVLVKREEAVAVILERLKEYRDREFIVGINYYGLEVSINYADGKFQSMILKGDGEKGERISDHIALRIVPAESKSKKKITVHAVLTIHEPTNVAERNYENYEIPGILRQALREGFAPRQDKNIVHRILKVYVDGEWSRVERVWKVIGNMVTTGYSLEYTYSELGEGLEKEMVFDSTPSIVPRSNLIIEDANPKDEKAFPETHFIFDDFVEESTVP